MIVLAGIIMIMNSGNGYGQTGFSNQADKVFNSLKTELFTPTDITNDKVIGSGGMNYKTHCHLVPKNGDILVDFNNHGLLAYNDSRNSFTKNVNIPAGKYKIFLESFDGYERRANTNPSSQSHEQYYVEFYNGSSKQATSGSTQDLRDRVRISGWKGVVNNSLQLPKNINKLVVRHKLKTNAPHSLRAICMMLEPIPQSVNGQCGNITLTGVLYNSAPTENLCAKGTKTEVTETHDDNARTWSWICKGVNGGHDSEVCQVHGKRSCATSPTQTVSAKYKTTLFIVQPNNEVTTITEGDHITLEGVSNSNGISKWLWIDAKPGTESYKGNRCVIEDKRGYSSNPRNPFNRRGTFPSLKKIDGVTLSEGEHHICLAGVITSPMSGFDSQAPQECIPHIVVKVEAKPASCGPEAGKSYKTIGELDSEKLCSEGHPVFKSSMSGTKQLCNNGIKQTSCYKDGDLSGCAQSVLDACFVPRWEWECQVGDGGEYVNCSSPRSAECGDSYVEGNEECDNGNNNGKICVPEYDKSCKYCDTDCQEQIVAGGDCGNGTKEGDEKCDDGDDNGKIPTVGYGKTETYCKTDCTIGTVVGGQCGNGTAEKDEECDDGNTANGDGCSATCQKEEEKQKKEPDCNSSIGNYIWYDTNANGIQEDIEEGIEGIKVCAFHGNKKYCDTTNKNGKYKIKNLCEGTYTVVVKDVGAMTQTFDPDDKKDNKTKVKLKNNDKHTKADFGYRGKAPSTGLATNIALLVGLSTLITIGILLVMRKRGTL